MPSFIDGHGEPFPAGSMPTSGAAGPPASAGDTLGVMTPPAAEEGYVSTRFGRVAYRVFGDRSPSRSTRSSGGGAAALLVVHGGPGLPSNYLEPLAELSDERPVVLYDQLGCGRSDRPSPGPWTTEYFVGELWKVRAALGLDRVHLYGHSSGSQIAVDYALLRPEGVSSYVLADPPLSIPRWLADLDVYRAALPAEVRAVLDRCEAAGDTSGEEYARATRVFYDRHFCRLSPWPPPLARALEGYSDEVYRTMWGASELCMTGTLKDYDRSARLGELDAPVLFLCGRHDEATPETTAWYRSLVPGAELAVVEDSSHTPHLENPEPTLAAVRGFLARVERREAGLPAAAPLVKALGEV